MLALRSPGSVPFNARVRLLRDSCIGRVLSATPPAASPAADLPYVDAAKLAEREEKAVAVSCVCVCVPNPAAALTMMRSLALSLATPTPALPTHTPHPPPNAHTQKQNTNRPQFAEAEALKIGVGVTREAQDVFDALAKTMPCRWDGTTITVLDEVSIVPPYTLDACAASIPADTQTLARVRKVLEAERARLGV
jgi:hypothetical protein